MRSNNDVKTIHQILNESLKKTFPELDSFVKNIDKFNGYLVKMKNYYPDIDRPSMEIENLKRRLKSKWDEISRDENINNDEYVLLKDDYEDFIRFLEKIEEGLTFLDTVTLKDGAEKGLTTYIKLIKKTEAKYNVLDSRFKT